MTTPRIYTYKVTFEEIPHWYWGVHKEKKYGELYLGSPKTHRWMWEFYTPKIQILEFFPYTNEGWKEANLVENRMIKPDLNNPLCLNENCNGIPSAEQLRKGAVKAGKKTGEYHKNNKTAVCDPVNQEKGRQTARERGVGFYDYDFQHSPEMIEMRKRNGKEAGARAVATGQIAQARSCINKDNQRRAGMENLKKAHAKISMPVDVLLPNGILLTFGSIKEASICLKIDQHSISKMAKNPGTRVRGFEARFSR